MLERPWPTGAGCRGAAGPFRFVHVSTDEVYGSWAPRAGSPRPPLRPQLALRRQQGGGRPSRARLAPHLRAAGGRHQLFEQLRPLPIPREADPAHRHQGAGGRAPAGLRHRGERARLDPRRGPRQRARGGADPGPGGRGLQFRRFQRAAEHRRGARDLRRRRRAASRRSAARAADLLRRRPRWPRRALRDRRRQGGPSSAGAPRRASRRASPTRCAGTWTTGLVGADPGRPLRRGPAGPRRRRRARAAPVGVARAG